MKNILISLPNDCRMGGSDEVLFQIAQSYAQRGDQVYVLFITKIRFGDWDILRKFVNVKLIDTEGYRERYGLCRYIYNICAMRTIRFDYVYISNYHIAGLFGRLRRLRLLNTRYLIAREMTSCFLRFRGHKLRRIRLYHRLGYQALDLLICQTDDMKRQFQAGAPKLANKIRIETVHNPINKTEINEKSAQAPFGLEQHSEYIVAAGRLVEEKGWDVLIKSFARLHTLSPHFRLIILGEGRIRYELETLIRSLDLESVVSLPGRVDNVYPYFKRAHMCVVSSRIEGFPNVLLQMMSQCDRVVSTLCAGGIDKIRGLVTCKPEDENALLEAMQYAISMPINGIREAFDQELSSRSIERFIAQCENFCNG